MAEGAIDIDGLEISEDDMRELLHVDREAWRAEVSPIAEFFAEFEDRLPPALTDQLEGLKRRLG